MTKKGTAFDYCQYSAVQNGSHVTNAGSSPEKDQIKKLNFETDLGKMDLRQENFLSNRRKTSNFRTIMSLTREKLRQFLPIFLLIGYSALGGVIFWTIEGKNARLSQNSVFEKNEKLMNETSRKICKLLDDYANFTADENATEQWWNVTNFSCDYDFLISLKKDLLVYARKLGLPHEDFTEWTFWGSVFYSATVCTSIGYGNMAPRTVLGRSLTMCYALVGIPLVLYNLAFIGKHFCYIIWNVYVLAKQLTADRRFKDRKNSIRRRSTEDISQFPIWLALLVTGAWILMCAKIYTFWEDWDFFTSFYFFFQSLTTIGFGDITPHHSTNMIWCFTFIIIGMSFVSMCWNLMQVKVAYIVEKLMKKIREKYLQSEMEENDHLVEESHQIEDEIKKISDSEGTWLINFMSENQQSALVEEWTRKARLRTKGVQVGPQSTNKSCQVETNFKEMSVQTTESHLLRKPIRHLISEQCLPDKEVILIGRAVDEPKSDEMKILFKKISTLLNDCQKTLNEKKENEKGQWTKMKSHSSSSVEHLYV